QNALGLDQVGIYDNFFEIGGDSIISIQVLARAKQAGLHFTPKDLFQYQSIAELTLVISSATPVRADQDVITGEVPLTPIQHWFFEQIRTAPHHYNQAVRLQVHVQVEPELLRQALHHLLLHHDALRLRFAPNDTGWRQWHAQPDEHNAGKNTVPFDVVDLAHLSYSEQEAVIEDTAQVRQAGLDLAEGPLIRLMLFQRGPDQPAVLLWVIHHLVVDGVSWRVLLEDVNTAYQQLERGEPVRLPPKTTAFKHWAEWLTTYARSEQLTAVADYWTALQTAEALTLPADNPTGLAHNTVASAHQLSCTLSTEETRALLQDAAAAYHTQVNDLLLTALAQAVSGWTGHQTVFIELEGHGREALAENLDLSRTVGWFTSLFPVLLRLDQTDPAAAIKSIKEQLRQVPQKGMDYGVLRYLTHESTPALWPSPPMSFNYLGQFDNVLENADDKSFIIGASVTDYGSLYSPAQTRPYLLEVDGLIVKGQLRFEWTYSRNVHQQQTIQTLADTFIEALRILIAHCTSPEAGGYTPSDFSLANLDNQKLSTLAGLIQQADQAQRDNPQ
ncbi:MAG: non-ribosomal peptide synthetase, partial [Anaerolineae bacterium]|nr:non-ribosomal peptide synthetase [Anaerolineae bacterium]